MRSARAGLRWSACLGVLCALSVLVGPASAVAAVYPSGGSTFTEGLEG